MDSADLALLRQAQRHISAAMEATADGEPLSALAALSAAQVACGGDDMNRYESDPQVLLLTPEQAAHRLGVGRSMVYELMAAGDLASVKIGRLRRIRVAEVERFAANLPETPGGLS